MNSRERKQQRRYDILGNIEAKYVDAQKTVLANKLGVTQLAELERAEEESLATAYESLLSQVRTDTAMTSHLLLHIHKEIFGGIYEWAGRWRTVSISKPGVIWPPPDYLEAAMESFEKDVLNNYPADSVVNDEAFCQAAAVMEGEFLAIHPFREGNARTVKLMVDLLALQTGRPLLAYDNSEAGRDAYIQAARAAISKDYRPMADVIAEALERTTR